VAQPKASLGVAKTNAPGVLARATIMQAAILAAIAMFASPPVTMAAFLLLIEAAASAQSASATKTKGLAAIRNTKIVALWTAMQTLKTYVQGLCDSTDAVSALALIHGAGLVVGKAGKATKLLLAATFIPATGVVHLAVNATLLIGKRSKKKTTFAWSWSTDGGKTWSAGVTTGYTTAEVPNLPPAAYLFRVCATVGKVVGEWSQPVTLTIH
jgi:hypothetical protein